MSGEALAHQPHRAGLVAALSAVGAAIVSMGVGSYLATTAENDLRKRQIRDQARSIARRPERERHHVRRLLAEIGIPKATMPPIEASIVRSRTRWLDFMVREHLGMHERQVEHPIQNAVVMGAGTGGG